MAIARALLKSQARILLLDEATSALDTPTEQAIQEQLEHLCASRKQTVIVIAHRLATLQKMDRLLVLEKGRLIEQGTHQSLLARPGSYYQALWAGTTPCTHQG